MADSEETETALLGWVGLVEEGEFEGDIEEGFDEVGAFKRGDLVVGEF